MKTIRSSILVLVTITSVTPANPQQQKPQNKRPPTKTHSAVSASPQQELPIANARDETLMLFWADPPQAQGGRPTAKGDPKGSAVWIGESGYLATCYHVIKGWGGPFKIGIPREPYVTEGSFSLGISGTVNTVVASLVATDPLSDVAILKAETPPSKIQLMPLVTGSPMGTPVTPREQIKPRGATLKTAPLSPGETVVLGGFPISNATQRSLILQPGIATGFLSLSQDGPPASALRIMISLVSNPGNSGGPVFNAQGEVVGLLEGNLQAPTRDETGLPVTYIRSKRDSNGQPILDQNHQPIFEEAPLFQNSGISFAVPARLIEELANKNKIDLR